MGSLNYPCSFVTAMALVSITVYRAIEIKCFHSFYLSDFCLVRPA